MAEQHKDLVGVHLEVNAVDSLESIVILLKQICNLYNFALLLLNENLTRNRLVVIRF